MASAVFVVLFIYSAGFAVKRKEEFYTVGKKHVIVLYLQSLNTQNILLKIPPFGLFLKYRKF